MFGLNVDQYKRTYCYAFQAIKGAFEYRKCDVCGRVVCPREQLEDTSFSCILEGGRKFPDFLPYMGSPMRFIISENALDLFEKNHISGYKNVSKVDIYREVKNQLLSINDVQYYSLYISGSVDFDLKKMALKKKNVCPKCGEFEWSRSRLYLVKVFFDMQSWDGSDLCRISSMPGYKVCSDRLKEIIVKNKLTGVEFRDENDIFKTY